MSKDGSCIAKLKDCEGCLLDCDLASAGPLRSLHYTVAGTEDWDPMVALPGFEEAEKRTRQRRHQLKAEPLLTEFEEIVKLLDLKRCPRCGKDWSNGKDKGEFRYSIQPYTVTYKGKKHVQPFAELTAKAMKLCPYCSLPVMSEHARLAVNGLKESSAGGGRV
eukprot:CAMPEP_0175227124 /NCGR_PEP_ID=MMETSP0093-20121207/23246_1 /TAXON_ID=311494 /ORGANISM="Alexandrium monilatum, Strain CCMP3105" /LENGTH=162 /DNA_ID=CAMNT_0016520869 /DNA_START=117 /DNA_END=605 /DNA_ORIENTATION=-